MLLGSLTVNMLDRKRSTKIFKKIQKYYQNEPKFNGVYTINNLPKKIGWSICNKS